MERIENNGQETDQRLKDKINEIVEWINQYEHEEKIRFDAENN